MNFECVDVKHNEDYSLDVKVLFILHTLYNLDTRIKVTSLFIADLIGVQLEVLEEWIESNKANYVFVRNMIRAEPFITDEFIPKIRKKNEDRHLENKQLFARLRKDYRARKIAR